MTVHEALELWGRPGTVLSHLPPSLLAIAQSPIVRCSGAPNGWAIGNVSDVVLARRFVYSAIEHNGPVVATSKWFELLRREHTRQEDLFWLTQQKLVNPKSAMDYGRDRENGRCTPTDHPLWGDLWGGVDKNVEGDAEVTSALRDETAALEGLCEDLARFDLLASVYAPYWERRAKEFDAAAELLDSPPFVCPQCRSAI